MPLVKPPGVHEHGQRIPTKRGAGKHIDLIKLVFQEISKEWGCWKLDRSVPITYIMSTKEAKQVNANAGIAFNASGLLLRESLLNLVGDVTGRESVFFI